MQLASYSVHVVHICMAPSRSTPCATEDPEGTLLNNDIPTDLLGIHARNSGQLRAALRDRDLSRNQVALGSDYPVELVHCYNMCNLRLIFPTIAQNTSPVTMLPQFVEILGRKLDLANDAKELHARQCGHFMAGFVAGSPCRYVCRTSCKKHLAAGPSRFLSHVCIWSDLLHMCIACPRLAGNIGKIVDKMQGTYEQLTNMQASIIASEISERRGAAIACMSARLPSCLMLRIAILA